MSTTMLDLDGVIYPWVDTFQPWLEDKLDIEMGVWDTWHHYRTIGIADADFVEHLHDFAAVGGFTWAAPFGETVDALWRLARAGHHIHVVTDRPGNAAVYTMTWLMAHNVPHDSITVGRDKTVFTEFGPGPYYAIDDRVENVQALRDHGVEAFLLTWPWNTHVDLPRVSSVAEYVEIVLAREGIAVPSGSAVLS